MLATTMAALVVLALTRASSPSSSVAANASFVNCHSPPSSRSTCLLHSPHTHCRSRTSSSSSSSSFAGRRRRTFVSGGLRLLRRRDDDGKGGGDDENDNATMDDARGDGGACPSSCDDVDVSASHPPRRMPPHEENEILREELRTMRARYDDLLRSSSSSSSSSSESESSRGDSIVVRGRDVVGAKGEVDIDADCAGEGGGAIVVGRGSRSMSSSRSRSSSPPRLIIEDFEGGSGDYYRRGIIEGVRDGRIGGSSKRADIATTIDVGWEGGYNGGGRVDDIIDDDYEDDDDSCVYDESTDRWTSSNGMHDCPVEPNVSFVDALRSRSNWLVGLLALQSCSGIVLSSNQSLLTEHPNIVYYLTMLVGAGGNAGNQASVRVIRGLALGTLNASTKRRYLVRELYMALSLSAILSAAGFARALVFGTPLQEIYAISLSLIVIVLSSVCLGAVLPLGLQAIGVDPAHSSTTIQVVMDILGGERLNIAYILLHA